MWDPVHNWSSDIEAQSIQSKRRKAEPMGVHADRWENMVVGASASSLLTAVYTKTRTKAITKV